MKKILVPTDFSLNSLKALRFAFSIAAETRAEVVVMHQMSLLEYLPNQDFTGLYVPPVAEQTVYAEKELARLVKKAAAPHKDKLEAARVVTEVVPGSGTVDIILETAKKHKVDTIIMGTTGATGLKRLFIGSVAAKVVGRSPVPVIVIPEQFRIKRIRKIGYASDLSTVEKELGKLAPYATVLNASVELFHVEPTFPVSKDYLKFKPETALPELQKKLKLDSLRYKLVKTKYDNDFYGGVDKYIRAAKPDMLCMISHRRNWVDKILNPSRSKGVSYHTKVPVLFIKG